MTTNIARLAIAAVGAVLATGIFLIPGATVRAQAGCTALRNGQMVTGNRDMLARLLATGPCPADAVGFRTLLQTKGGKVATAFIDNRGFHNPGSGSFSLFGTVSGQFGQLGAVQDGELFFGHFTVALSSRLALDLSPARNNLMLEAIAWDNGKGFYNFYELRGNGSTGTWSYAGDSADILADTELLHRQKSSGQVPFGSRLRCSHCHVNGGPIMKELAAPHNDWWTVDRQLPLGGRQLDARLAALATGFVSADTLSAAVRAGLDKLAVSPQFNTVRAGRSLQEQLRPLFCAVEINLESDLRPLDDNLAGTSVPSGMFVDPRLAAGPLQASRADYDAALRTTGSRFPEIDRRDADHAWLGPVKGSADQVAVRALVDSGLIDGEFVSDVLAVDFTNPALSVDRCGLLKRVPLRAAQGWQADFRAALLAAGDRPAKELLANFTDASRNEREHRATAARFLDACGARLKAPAFVVSALRLLAQRRQEIATNEISSDPQRQILEPGFRLIFPNQSGAPSGRLRLSETCEVTSSASLSSAPKH
ncbi:MAG: hypothetical protein ABI868_01875 [Acidobacteriota bacterium]